MRGKYGDVAILSVRTNSVVGMTDISVQRNTISTRPASSC